MKSHLEGMLERYVVATLGNPTQYLIFKDNNVSFTKYISRATKTIGRNTAQDIKNDFYSCTGMTDMELVVLPIRISYEIIQECLDMDGEVYDVIPW